MQDQEYILLILNCKKYFKKALFQKMTWLMKIPSNLKYYHVIGNEGLDTDFRFEDETNILWVKTPDDYISLTKKVMSAYNAVNTTFNYKYIFKTDDDQYLKDTNFFNMMYGMIQSPIKSHYGGWYISVNNEISKYNEVHPELPNNILMKKTIYCSGRFYYLSYEAVNNLLSFKEQIDNEYLEDYAIGFYLSEDFKKTSILVNSELYFKEMDDKTIDNFFKKKYN